MRMQRIFTVILFLMMCSIPIATVSAQDNPVGTVGDIMFMDGTPNCSGSDTVTITVFNPTNTPAWVTATSGITRDRTVGFGQHTVSLVTSATGNVYDGVFKLVTRFGPVRQSSQWFKQTNWYDCDTGRNTDVTVDARGDYYYIPSELTSTFDILENDISRLSFSSLNIYDGPSKGTLVAVAGERGVYQYTPGFNDDGSPFIGRDSFDYRVCNTAGFCDGNTVTIDVFQRPQPSITAVRLIETTCDAAGLLEVDLIYAGGEAWVTADSSITDTEDITDPDTSTVGTQTVELDVSSAGVVVAGFAFRVDVLYGPTSNNGDFDQNHYWFNCNTGGLINPSLNAINDTFTVLEDFQTEYDVATNDTSILPLDFSTLSIIDAPTRGTAGISPNDASQIVYQLTDGVFSGTDTFTYEICNIDEQCDIASVTVNIEDLPAHAITSITLPQPSCDGIATLDVSVIYSGRQGWITAQIPTSQTVVDITSDDFDTFGLEQTQAMPLTVTPDDIIGVNILPVDVLYGIAVNDSTYDTDTKYFNCITGELIDPSLGAVDDTFTVLEDFQTEYDVTANDGSTLPFDFTTLTIIDAPTRGTAGISSNDASKIVYQLTDGVFSGTDTFTYEICNVDEQCDIASVTVSIEDLPDPVITSVSLPEPSCDGIATLDVSVIYSGRQGWITAQIPTSQTVVDITSNDFDTFGLEQTQAMPLTVTPEDIIPENVLIVDVFYGVAENDATYDSDTYYFDCVTGEPVSPEVNAVDDFVPLVGRALTTEIDVLANDVSLIPLAPSTLRITEQPPAGTIEIVDGIVIYTGDGFFEGEAVFMYEICNIADFCDTASVTLDIINLYGVVPFEVCWVGNLSGGMTLWKITNPNAVPMETAPEKKALYNWEVSLGGDVLQSATRWDNGGDVLVNTILADLFILEWFVLEAGTETGIIGRTGATATEADRCDTSLTNVEPESNSNRTFTNLTPASSQVVQETESGSGDNNDVASNNSPSTQGNSANPSSATNSGSSNGTESASNTPDGETSADETPAENPPPSNTPSVAGISVCWIGNPNGNSSAWQVTNTNGSDVLYDWQVMSGDTVVQSGSRWTNSGTVRINTGLGDRITVRWYTDEAGTLGSAGASAGNSC